MSADAEIESMFWFDDDSKRVTEIQIRAFDGDILIEKEDLPA